MAEAAAGAVGAAVVATFLATAAAVAKLFSCIILAPLAAKSCGSCTRLGS